MTTPLLNHKRDCHGAPVSEVTRWCCFSVGRAIELGLRLSRLNEDHGQLLGRLKELLQEEISFPAQPGVFAPLNALNQLVIPIASAGSSQSTFDREIVLPLLKYVASRGTEIGHLIDASRAVVENLDRLAAE